MPAIFLATYLRPLIHPMAAEKGSTMINISINFSFACLCPIDKIGNRRDYERKISNSLSRTPKWWIYFYGRASEASNGSNERVAFMGSRMWNHFPLSRFPPTYCAIHSPRMCCKVIQVEPQDFQPYRSPCIPSLPLRRSVCYGLIGMIRERKQKDIKRNHLQPLRTLSTLVVLTNLI